MIENARPGPSSVFVWTSSSPSTVVFPSVASFVAGGVAGAASRTVTSPLERLKILLQVEGSNGMYKKRGIYGNLRAMFRDEGWRGFFRGNGMNVLRIAPHSAIQFATFEFLSSLTPPSTASRLASGAAAGMLAVVMTYPLDLIRSRLSISGAKLRAGGSLVELGKGNGGFVGMSMKIIRDEGGVKGLYRGLTPTALGVGPYVAGNFTIYEALKTYLSENGDGTPLGTMTKLLCGGVAGSVSQTITYPLDLLRRRMQTCGVKSLGYEYSGSLNAIATIIRTEGLRGMFGGLKVNLVKVAPSIGVSFSVYELVKDYLEDRALEGASRSS